MKNRVNSELSHFVHLVSSFDLHDVSQCPKMQNNTDLMQKASSGWDFSSVDWLLEQKTHQSCFQCHVEMNTVIRNSKVFEKCVCEVTYMKIDNIPCSKFLTE